MTVINKLGSTVVPAEPRRVIALSGQDADVAVALGVLPVAMTRYFYRGVGGRTPWLAAKPGSLEQLGTLDADVLIMSDTSDDLRTSLENTLVFQAVPAVRNGHYLPLSVDSISALILPSVLSIPYGLDQLEPGLAKALS